METSGSGPIPALHSAEIRCIVTVVEPFREHLPNEHKRGAARAQRAPSLTFHNAGEGGRVPGNKDLELLIQAADARVNVPRLEA